MVYLTNDNLGQAKLAAQANPPIFPLSGSFRLIVADPPWSYHLRESDASHRGRTPYPNMTDQAILDLGVGAIAAPNSYLLLWSTNNHIPVAIQCMELWGFRFKAIHSWVKVTKAGGLRIGLGHYGRNCTEHFLVGIRGSPGSWSTLGLRDIPTALLAQRSNLHSQKPPEFWTIADKLGDALGGDRIELFAREQRPGWAAWGLEVDDDGAA